MRNDFELLDLKKSLYNIGVLEKKQNALTRTHFK